MPNDMIRYDLLVQEALCGVVGKVLADAAKNGLPGDHHFYITFRTHAPGVRLSSRMRDAYPDEMTIILQHQFEGLKVGEHGFEVGLSFKNIPEILHVPFEAMTGFFDPSVQFSLKFEPLNEADTEDEPGPVSAPLAGPRGDNVVKPASLALAALPRAVDSKAGDAKATDPRATDPKTADATAAEKADPKPLAAKPQPARLVPAEAGAGDEGDASPPKVVSIDAFRKKP